MSTIVCGVDGSPGSQLALRAAARLAGRLGADLVLAHVVEPVLLPYATAAPFGGLSGAGVLALEEERSERQDAAHSLLAELAAAAGIESAEQWVAAGDPAERLAELADERDALLIVAGSRGRGAVRAAFLGSVSTSLVGIARCPVLVVPHGVAETPLVDAAVGARG